MGYTFLMIRYLLRSIASAAINKSGPVLLNILSDQSLFVGNTPLAGHAFLFIVF